MKRSEREIIETLGAAGLAVALGDALDASQLVRLANACSLSYPGMRTRSQKRERILSDLVEKMSRDDFTRKTVIRALRKATSAAAREWTSLSADERARRLRDGDILDGRGKPGVGLFVLADAASEPVADETLKRMLAPAAQHLDPDRGRPASELVPDNAATERSTERVPGPEVDPREIVRLRKRIAELQKKVAYLESQLAKGRDIEKTLRRDLIQRKGELAESRMLVERLSREIHEIRGASEVAAQQASPASGGPAAENLAGAVRKLAGEHRKLAHRIDRLLESTTAPRTTDTDAISGLAAMVADLQKDSSALRRERRKDLLDQARRLEEMLSELKGLRAAVTASTAPPKAAKSRKGEPERVGVFIDVQNMYYAARQLKGKLDFDALLQTAVRDRRLIQASAYVVETREIDQSGFIAMLQQRGIEVRRKTLKVRSDGSMKGDWDMEMALDILDAASRLDVVVLVSGDGDFTSLVNRVKGIGPRVEVVGFPRNTAKSLVEAADQFQALDRKFMIRTEDDASVTRRVRPSADGREAGDADVPIPIAPAEP